MNSLEFLGHRIFATGTSAGAKQLTGYVEVERWRL
jgi:hypothetical protein